MFLIIENNINSFFERSSRIPAFNPTENLWRELKSRLMVKPPNIKNLEFIFKDNVSTYQRNKHLC